MVAIVSYKSLNIASPDPVGSGGLLINNNFKAIADNMAAHSGDMDNPHQVTTTQIGAIPTSSLNTSIPSLNSAGYIPNTQLARPRVRLPKEVISVDTDTLQLFTSAIVEAPDPYVYPFNIYSQKGDNYPRIYEYTPITADVTSGGLYTIVATISNYDGSVIDSGVADLRVITCPQQPQWVNNILCVGDSLTHDGYWVGEVCRRLTSVSGAPSGLGYTSIQFVGDKPLVGHSGHSYIGWGGWRWTDYLGTTNQLGRASAYAHSILTTGNFGKTADDVGSVWGTNEGNFWILERVFNEYTYNNTRQTISNSGFETGDFTAWNGSAAQRPNCAIINTDSYRGNYCLSMSGDYNIVAQTTLAIYSGYTQYCLSMWSKCINKGGGCKIGMSYDDGAGHNVYYNGTSWSRTPADICWLPNDSGVWKQTQIYFTTPSGEALSDGLGGTFPRIIRHYILNYNLGANYYVDHYLVRPATMMNGVKFKLYSGTDTFSPTGTIKHHASAINTTSVDYFTVRTEPNTPFWNYDNNQCSFKQWEISTGLISGIQTLIVLLGWNNVQILETNSTIINNATSLLNIYHNEYPSGNALLCGIQLPSLNGGLGYTSHASSLSANTYAMMCAVNNLNQAYDNLCTALNQSGNLIYNGDFETSGTTTPCAYWNRDTSTGGSVYIATENPYQGTRSAYLRTNGLTAYGANLYTNNIPVIPRSKYNLSFKARGVPANSGTFYITMGSLIPVDGYTTTTYYAQTGWSSYNYTFTTPTGCSSLAVAFQVCPISGNAIYLDDVKLYRRWAFYVPLAQQFDAENNMPWAAFPANSRVFSNGCPTWAGSTTYTAGDHVKYDQLIYRCLASHTADSNFLTDNVNGKWIIETRGVEFRGTNNVHTTTEGQYQIADAIYREFLYTI